MARRLKGIEEFGHQDVRSVRSARKALRLVPTRRRHRVRDAGIALILMVAAACSYGYLRVSKGPPRTGTDTGNFTTAVMANAFSIAGRPVPAMTVTGRIMPGAARAFSTAVDRSGLKAGDTAVLSDLGGAWDDAMAIGEDIRRRGLNTVVGRFDDHGAYRPSTCSGACLLALAGGVNRIGMSGVTLGVESLTADAVSPLVGGTADLQARAGRTVGYLVAMGVSPVLFQRMTEAVGRRDLGSGEALDLRLLTAMGE